MVDAAIVMIENLHKHLEREPVTAANRWEIVRRAATEVGPTLFLSLLIVTLSFLPVLALQGEEGRLFAPLAYTKTYAMAAAAMLSVTLVPVLLGLFVRGRIRPETENPINRGLIAAYRPLLDWTLRRPVAVLVLGLGLTLAGVWPALHLGSEFMPDLDEGDLLYMPTTYPGIAPDKARQILQQTDRLILTVPEVARVFGKVGRAETATDPAPMEMIETTIQLKPRDQWRPGMTIDGIKAELERTVNFPGLTNSWLMPINARLQMLSTGIKTPVGIKVAGPDLAGIQALGEQIEEVLGRLPGTGTVFAERITAGRYVQITPDRVAMGRVGLTVTDIQEIIATAVGGMNLTEVVEGRERYPVSLRYTPDTRDSVERLRRLPIVVERNGIRFAFLGINQIDERVWAGENSPGTAPLSRAYIDKIKAEITSAKQIADVVIVLPHWGVEYTPEPQDIQRVWAREFINAGASLVIGNHPHIIQPMEVYSDKLIFYALGNFVFDQEQDFQRESIVVEVNFVGTEIESWELHPINTNYFTLQSHWAKNAEAEYILARVKRE